MNKLLLVLGFLVGVNSVSGCDKNIHYDERYVFSKESDAVVRDCEYCYRDRKLVCRNMIPEDFEKCDWGLDTASIVEFTNCDFGDGISCENAFELIFTNCPQVEDELSARRYVALWYYRVDADITIDGRKV